MKHSLARWGIVGLLAAAVAGCGGGGGSSPVAPAVPVVAANSAIAAASTLAANDTASNSAAPFTVLQSAGISAVVVNGAPKVNFAVFSNGAVKADLKIADVSFAIA